MSNETDNQQQTAMSAEVARLARVNGAVRRARLPGSLAFALGASGTGVAGDAAGDTADQLRMWEGSVPS